MGGVMAGLLSNFRNTMAVSLAISLLFIIGYGVHHPGGFDVIFFQALFRWIHVVCGILWIGLLYYFNFVQIRMMPAIPAELKPAVSKYIAPEALFWFRWAALFTVLAGLGIAVLRGYVMEALTFGFWHGLDPVLDRQYMLLGVGMWLGLIMFFNVWALIWPNQKVALGIVDADADAKAKAARTAMLFSRVNVLLSLPMLTAMAMNQTLFG
jgi:uncharacterized membrane protein